MSKIASLNPAQQLLFLELTGYSEQEALELFEHESGRWPAFLYYGSLSCLALVASFIVFFGNPDREGGFPYVALLVSGYISSLFMSTMETKFPMENAKRTFAIKRVYKYIKKHNVRGDIVSS